MKSHLVAATMAFALSGFAVAQAADTGTGNSMSTGVTNGATGSGDTGTVGREKTGANNTMPRTQTGQTGSATGTGSGGHGAGGGGPQPVVK